MKQEPKTHWRPLQPIDTYGLIGKEKEKFIKAVLREMNAHWEVVTKEIDGRLWAGQMTTEAEAKKYADYDAANLRCF